MHLSIRRASALLLCAFAVACNSMLGIKEAAEVTEDEDNGKDDPLLASLGTPEEGSGIPGGSFSSAGSCLQGEMPCQNACVPIDNPRYGCGRECGPPCSLPNVEAYTCQAKACAVYKCKSGWGDCNDDPSDGCEADLGAPENCGECGNHCPEDAPECVKGTCGTAPTKEGAY